MDTSGATSDPPWACRAALAVLVILVVLSPWPFGSVQPSAVRVVAAISLGTALVALALQARSGAHVAAIPLWALAGLALFAVVQLLPLPAALHAVLAPASQALWHPAEPAARAVLANGLRPISIDPDATRRWLGLTAGVTGLALVAAPALERRKRALGATLGVLSGALGLGVYAVVARSAFGPLLFGRLAVPTLSPFGPFVSKNHFAGYTAMATLLALGLAVGLIDRENRGGAPLDWTASPRASRVVLAAALAAALGLSVLVSLSRGGALSLAAGVLALLLLRAWVRRRRRASARGLAVAAAALIVIVAGFAFSLPGETRQRLGSVAGAGREASGSFRLDTWGAALRMAAASPIAGHGFGAFADGLPRFKRGHGELRVEHAENDYVELLAEGGMLGLGLALGAIALGLGRALAGLREQDDRLLRGLGLGALAGVAGLLVHSALDFNLRIPSNALLFAFLAALGLAAAGRSFRLSRAATVAALAAAGLAAFLVAQAPLSAPPLPRDDLKAAAAIADPAARGLRLELAAARLARVLERRPAHAEAWVLLGWTRAAQGDATAGAALTAYGASLDPQRQALRVRLPGAAPAPQSGSP